MPDPSRDEVDDFLEKQAFRVRHEAALSEARRESILTRIQSAIGRVLPNGATFHAWKNVVAEAFARVRRRAAAAFLVGALSVGLGACGNTGEGPDVAAPVSGAPTISAPAHTYDTEWDTQDPAVLGSASSTFTAAEVAAATGTVAAINEELAFNENILRDANLTADDYQRASAFMTPTCASAFSSIVDEAVASDATTTEKISAALIAYPNAKDAGIDYPFQAKGPAVVNPATTNTIVAFDTVNSQPRMKISQTVTADLRMVRNGNPVLVPVKKNITYWLAPVDGARLDWRIDGYSGEFVGAGAIRPDRGQ